MKGLMRPVVVACWLSGVLAQSVNVYESSCNDKVPTRATVGKSCRTMNQNSSEPPDNMQLRTTALAVAIREGRGGEPMQYRWTTMPRNITSAEYRAKDNFAISEKQYVRNWPICAAAGQKCKCANGGYAAIVDVYEDSNYQISSTAGNVTCNSEARVFTGFRATEANKVYCRCGQPLTPTEQWSTFTDNCLGVGSRYRTANGVGVAESCMGMPADYNMNIFGKLTAVNNSRPSSERFILFCSQRR